MLVRLTGSIIGCANKREDKVADISSTSRAPSIAQSVIKLGLTAREDKAPPHLVQRQTGQLHHGKALRRLHGTDQLSNHVVKAPLPASRTSQRLYNPGKCTGQMKKWVPKMVRLMVLLLLVAVARGSSALTKCDRLTRRSKMQIVTRNSLLMQQQTWRPQNNLRSERCQPTCKCELYTNRCILLKTIWAN